MASLDEARALLASGDFGSATQAVGELLEANPDDADLMSGFYAASYWEHRQGLLQAVPSDRSPGAYLLEEWAAFEARLREKKLENTPTVDAAMRAVLGLAARQYRHLFQDGRVGAADFDSLLQLSRSMVRLKDWNNARDLLLFTLKLQPNNTAALVLLGECRCLLGQAENDQAELDRGYGHFRDAFLLSPAPVDPERLSATLLHDLLHDLRFRFGPEEQGRATLWLPAEFMAAVFSCAGIRALHADEILQLEEESDRLERELDDLAERYQEKAAARLAFYTLVLLHALTHHYRQDEHRRFLLQRLGSLAPGLARRIQKG